MNFIEFESEQKLRGGFYTEQPIARFLSRWLKSINPEHILEPSCGDGAFLEAMESIEIPSLKRIVACEIDANEAQKASDRTALPLKLNQVDFLRWYLTIGQYEDRFDGVLGNPPFIRYQYLPASQQSLAEKVFSQLGLPFTKHTNAWVPFVIGSLKLLRPGGRLAMVIPSEIFHIPHAQSLRQYLADQCSKILIIDPEEIWFNDTLQGTVLLMAEKKHESHNNCNGVSIVSAKSRSILYDDPEAIFRNAVFSNGETIKGKWMRVLLSESERTLINALGSHEMVRKFAAIASVDVGIVTGANKFFLVPRSTVEEFDLSSWAHPMFGRSDHVKGLIFTQKDFQNNQDGGLPSNFLLFDEDDPDKLPNNVRKYLSSGLAQGLHKRFKCRTRKVWYKVPSVYTSEIAMLKRAHNYPRLVLNEAKAYTTDTAYRIRTLSSDAPSLVSCFVNSLTCLSAELEGRHYGGGVLELVPSEIERLLIPVVSTTKAELRKIDCIYRQSKSDMDFLSANDRIILSKIGISRADQDILFNAWYKLKSRRQRTE